VGRLVGSRYIDLQSHEVWVIINSRDGHAPHELLHLGELDQLVVRPDPNDYLAAAAAIVRKHLELLHTETVQA
jgi:hypothetical protein